MSKVEKQSAALALFVDHAVAPNRRDKIIEQAKAQLDTLVGQRKQGPYRAIALGMLLHQLKAGCKHGEWMPLYEQILKSSKFVTASTAQTYCSQYMRLATEFLVEAEAARPEFIALAGSKTELNIEAKDATERALASKMESFIDGRSLDELLTDYDLRNASAKKKRKLAKEKASKDTDEAVHEVTVQDRFNEIDELLKRARVAASDKAVWMSFSKKQHGDLKAAAEQTAEVITALYVKTHGRNAKA